MKGCLFIGGAIILVIALIFGIMGAVIAGQFALAGVLAVATIAILALLIVKGRRKNSEDMAEYVKANPTTGFFRPLNKNTDTGKRIEFDIVEGPTMGDKLKIDLSNMNYWTYLLNAGDYTANVKYIITTMNTRNELIETILGEQTIKFRISPRKLHTLAYDKKSDEYSFEELEVPKELKYITDMMDKLN